VICDTSAHIIAAAEGQILGEGEDEWECCRGVHSQLHLNSTLNRVNSTQTRRDALQVGFAGILRGLYFVPRADICSGICLLARLIKAFARAGAPPRASRDG
jgi:hypothetical protein